MAAILNCNALWGVKPLEGVKPLVNRQRLCMRFCEFLWKNSLKLWNCLGGKGKQLYVALTRSE